MHQLFVFCYVTLWCTLKHCVGRCIDHASQFRRFSDWSASCTVSGLCGLSVCLSLCLAVPLSLFLSLTSRRGFDRDTISSLRLVTHCTATNRFRVRAFLFWTCNASFTDLRPLCRFLCSVCCVRVAFSILIATPACESCVRVAHFSSSLQTPFATSVQVIAACDGTLAHFSTLFHTDLTNEVVFVVYDTTALWLFHLSQGLGCGATSGNQTVRRDARHVTSWSHEHTLQ